MNYPLGTLDIEACKDAIYEWIQLVTTGVVGPGQILWRNQTQALPKRPCVTMKIIKGPYSQNRNGATFQTTDAKGVTNVGIQMQMIVSIQVFGDSRETEQLKPRRSAMQIGLDLNSSLIQQTILDKLKAGGVAIQDIGELDNLTALEETEYEDRVGFEILCGLVQNVSDSPGFITTVNGTLTADDQTEDFTAVLP